MIPNMNVIHCRIVFGTYNKWIRHIVSGFCDLASAGRIDLEVKSGDAPFGLMPIVKATIDGAFTVAYDAHDGYNYCAEPCDSLRRLDEMSEAVDLWFKYTCLNGVNEKLKNRDKILPLGLGSTFLGSRHNPYDTGVIKPDWRQIICNIAGATAFTATLTRHNSRHMWPDAYEAPPSSGNGTAIFVARVWDPNASEVSSQESRRNRADINLFRVALVREARRVLGTSFIGGIQDDSYARKYCPDCISKTPVMSNRWDYLRAIRNCSVGIASDGLHGVVGGKLAEYLAASRPVVTTPLQLMLPGDFMQGDNYLPDADPVALIRLCEGLLKDPAKCNRMMQANARYYSQYVRPAAMIERTLRISLNHQGVA